jgi:hypothetical protein
LSEDDVTKMPKFEVDRPERDQVDRVVGEIRSAIGPLARLSVNDDSRIMAKAANELRLVGTYAAGPIAKALSRSDDPRHRLGMLVILRHLGSGPTRTSSRCWSAWPRRNPSP